MRAVVQRVGRASVRVGEAVVGAIGCGLLVLLGVAADDTQSEADTLLDKILGLRIFENDEGKFDRSIRDVGGSLLVVSQFTLFADTSRGRRPSFSGAARPAVAEPLYEYFAQRAQQLVETATGSFGAHMAVESINDGPVTIVIDTREQ